MTYHELLQIIERMSDISWVEPSCKVLPIRHLTPITFWFIICSQYFPRECSEDALLSRYKFNFPL